MNIITTTEKLNSLTGASITKKSNYKLNEILKSGMNKKLTKKYKELNEIEILLSNSYHHKTLEKLKKKLEIVGIQQGNIEREQRETYSISEKFNSIRTKIEITKRENNLQLLKLQERRRA